MTASISADRVSLQIPMFEYGASKILGRRGKAPGGNWSRPVKNALEDISFDLEAGDRLGIIGANGSGKTSLLRLIAGIYSPSSGVLDVRGKISSMLDIAFGIEPDLSGREAIHLRGAMLGFPKKLVARKEEEIIDFSGLGKAIDAPTRSYSSGMFVRLAFSIATVTVPQILIMDEWLSVGDQDFRGRAESRLRQIVKDTELVVMASHSSSLVVNTCNKGMWLENGNIRAEGSAEEVCNGYFV